MVRLAACVLAVSCAAPAPKPATEAPPLKLSPGPSRDELKKVPLSLDGEPVGTDPSLKEHAAALKAALQTALAGEGFSVVDRPAGKGELHLKTSIDYSPWTAVSAASLYIVLGLEADGSAVDQVELQKVNEAFPEPAKVGELASTLAHSLATSPRLKDFLTPAR